jgi:D-beta-D-heptose 7-phosphate kinase/D-beta-D-heptose 1-phosphate adenosyltransferase
VGAVISVSRAAALVARWKQRGLTVGFTNGCFDILHPGHVSLLKAARAECDRLIVALNSDASIRQLKGPTRPINDLTTRAQMISAIRYVDCTVAFDAETPLDLIRRLVPDVLVKGGDYSVDTVVGADVVQAEGGRVHIVELVPGKSSTEIISRVGALALKPAETS